MIDIITITSKKCEDHSKKDANNTYGALTEVQCRVHCNMGPSNCIGTRVKALKIGIERLADDFCDRGLNPVRITKEKGQ